MSCTWTCSSLEMVAVTGIGRIAWSMVHWMLPHQEALAWDLRALDSQAGNDNVLAVNVPPPCFVLCRWKDYSYCQPNEE